MTAIEQSRLEREWRAEWAAEGIDWRTVFDGLPRRVGQRHQDGFVRVADSCEPEHFAREGRFLSTDGEYDHLPL